MAGDQSTATAAAAASRAQRKREADALLKAQRLKRDGASGASTAPSGSEAPKQGAGKGLMKRPLSEPSSKVAPDRHSKKKAKVADGSAAVGATDGAEQEYVHVDDSSPQAIITAPGGSSVSQSKTRKPRGKKPPFFQSYFPAKYWTRSERADLEMIFTRFSPPDLIGDHPVLEAYRPPFLLDREDSAHDDPDVCMMALQNAYLPADRATLKDSDYGLLISEMFMHLKKATDMALEYRNRTEHISNQAGGLQGFIDRATNATLYALRLEEELKTKGNEASGLQKLLDQEREETSALKAQVASLEKERSELAENRRHFKESAALAREKLKASEALLETQQAEFASERVAWEARKGELEGMVLESHEFGFEKCLGQISRKYPNHGLDLSVLDPLEEDPEAPAEEQTEATDGAGTSAAAPV